MNLAEESRIYVIPLGRVHGVPHTKRSPYAMKIIRHFVERHMKVEPDEEIVISPLVNEAVWARGIQKPPARIRVKVSRHETKEGNLVDVQLPDEE